MGFIWFWIVAAMLAAYVVLDGFDLGVGILSPVLRAANPTGRSCSEHRPGLGRQRSVAARRWRHALFRLPRSVCRLRSADSIWP